MGDPIDLNSSKTKRKRIRGQKVLTENGYCYPNEPFFFNCRKMKRSKVSQSIPFPDK